MRQPWPAQAGRPFTSSSLWPTSASAPAPRAFREALSGVPGWAVGPGCRGPAPRLAGHAHGGREVSRHGAGGTRSAGPGPARTGECASGSPRTHLGVGFVRMCSHLRRSLVLGAEATSTLAAPGENLGNQGERERPRRQQGGAFRGFCWPYRCGSPGSRRPAQPPEAGTFWGWPTGLGADPEEPLPCPDSQEWALAAAWPGDAVLSRELLPALEHPSRRERHLRGAPPPAPSGPRGWAPPSVGPRPLAGSAIPGPQLPARRGDPGCRGPAELGTRHHSRSGAPWAAGD